jgi:glycosyltransferase involved in cell wall biosynthesis
MSDFIPRTILHIELSQDIPILVADTNPSFFYVVFWWHGIPLGHQEILNQQLPMSAEQLLDLAVQTITPALKAHFSKNNILFMEASTTASARELMKIWEQPFINLCKEWSKSENFSVSVVICTRDRPEQIAECLRSLKNLSHPPEEIVVVDNAPSSDATRQIVAQIPGVRYVLEPRPGLDFARNAGIYNSTGEIIAYTDDDVVVHNDWVMRLRQSFRDPQVMALTGLVIAAELETESQYIFEKYWSFNRGYQSLMFDSQYFAKYQFLGVPAWRIGAGANMAFRRKVFELVGDFDERLDVGAAGCSGDSEYWYRVLAEGGICRYEPTAVVYHTHRKDMDSLQRQIFFYMRGHVTELLIRFEKYRHWGNIVRLALMPVHFTYVILFGIFKQRPRLKTILAEIRGCFSGVKFYFHHQKLTYSLKKNSQHPIEKNI